MKGIILTAMIAVLVMAPTVAFANDTPLANIKVSSDWGKAQCVSQPGKGITLVWAGVSDKRTNPAVGLLKVKKEESEVKLAGSPDAVIGEAVKAVFANCGFTVETKKDAGGVKTSVDLVDLFAGAKKGFLTGETDAKGSLILHFSNGGSTYDFNLGATKADKRLKKKNIKQLEEVLTGLLESIVTQIGESPSLFTEVKQLAGK